MRAILHIGVNKTGTTSIQSFLADNRKCIIDHGFFYPRVPGVEQHRKLASYAFDDDRFDTYQRMKLGIVDDVSLNHFREKFSKAFRRELSHLDKRVKTVIFSSELCSSLKKETELQRLKGLLDEFFDDIRIVVYLRRQDELAVSLYSTKLKGGGSSSGQVFNSQWYLNYERLLNHWASVFDEDKIDVRIYSKDDLKNNDALTDFLEYCGLPSDGLGEPPDRLNTSLDPRAQMFLKHFNKYVPKAVDGEINPLRGPLKSYMEKYFSGLPILPVRKEALEFYGKYELSNKNVCKKWFPGRNVLFSENFSKYPEEQADLNFTFEDAVEVSATLWGDLMKENIRLQDENSKLVKERFKKVKNKFL